MANKVESYGATDVGLRRQTNQDCLLFDDAIGLYVVADGMGGHSAGEVASKLAVDTVHTFVRQNRLSNGISWPGGIEAELSYSGNLLRTAIMLANLKVWEESESRAELAGMGTTIVAALAEDNVLTVGSAGDSRVYRIRRNEIRQLTTDDSWVQAALEKGVLNRDQLRNHAMRNVITKAIGANEDIEPRIIEEPLEPGDLCLLCSDGLHGIIGDYEILELVRSAGDDLKGAVENLIAAAKDGGGKDNITVILVRSKSPAC
jgi:protein phosphatase